MLGPYAEAEQYGTSVLGNQLQIARLDSLREIGTTASGEPLGNVLTVQSSGASTVASDASVTSPPH